MKAFGWIEFSSMRSLVVMLVLGVALSGFAGEVVATGQFVKKEKSIAGSFIIRELAGRLVLELNDDFKTKSGPDLKVVFSPLPLAQTTGKNAMSDGSVVVSLLKSTKGRQTYQLPDSIQLVNFKSLLIHCEKYDVLWGGSDLTAQPAP